jgi:hypothetical protein
LREALHAIFPAKILFQSPLSKLLLLKKKILQASVFPKMPVAVKMVGRTIQYLRPGIPPIYIDAFQRQNDTHKVNYFCKIAKIAWFLIAFDKIQ